MNENPGGTPSPLNTTPVGQGRVPAPNPSPNSNPNLNPAPKPVASPTPNQTPVAPTQPAPQGAATLDSIKIDSLAPEDRPMEQAVPEPEKKKKTGLIVGIIIALAVLVGGVVAAILIINSNNSDPVSEAIMKIVNNGLPEKITLNGEINTLNTNISIDSNIITNSGINDTKLTLSTNIPGAADTAIDVEEIYAGDENIYFKISGAKDLYDEVTTLYLMNNILNQSSLLNCENEDDCPTLDLEQNTCEEGEECDEFVTDSETMNAINTLSLLQYFEDGWIAAPIGQSDLVNEIIPINTEVDCVTNILGGLKNNSNSIAETYKKYPFIMSTNKDISLVKKDFPVYKLDFDNEKLSDFIQSIQENSITGNAGVCSNFNNLFSEENIKDFLSNILTIYAEVDNDKNFTRIYLDVNGDNNLASLTIDFDFYYPGNINVSKPSDSKNIEDVIQNQMLDMDGFFINEVTGSDTSTLDNED